MKIKQLVFLMIIVLIVFSLIELVFAQTSTYSPQMNMSITSTHMLSTTSVDEWQLYENEKYGDLELKYPSEWQITTDEFTPTTESVSGKQDEPESFEQNASITLFDDKTISVTGYEAMGHAVMGLDIYANR